MVGRFGYMTVVRHDLEIEGGGPSDIFTMQFNVDCVSVAAITEDGRYVLVRQHRYGVDALTIEVAGGVIDAGEAPAEAAARELREETGHLAASIEPLGVVHINPAFQDNRCYLFLARGARPAGELACDPLESIEPLLMTRGDLVAAITGGQITHALSVLALERALARRLGLACEPAWK